MLFALVAFFAMVSLADAGNYCPWCHNTGIYNAPAVNYTTQGVILDCAMCGETYSSLYGHSCSCRKCGINGGGSRVNTTPSRGTSDYSNDIFFQSIDWDKVSVGSLYYDPCRMVTGMWKDRNTAFAQFQLCKPMQNSMYQYYGGLVDQLATMKASELSQQYGRRITSVVELYDCYGNLLRRAVK